MKSRHAKGGYVIPLRPAAADPTLVEDLRGAIREIRDFPIPGVGFKDITPVLASPALFGRALAALVERLRPTAPTHIAAIESRGFLVGAPVALALDAALAPIRKVGKLPFRTERIDYTLEYGAAALEVHADAWEPGARVLVIDDVLATGGTALAACALVERMGAEVAGCGFLLSLPFLGGEQRLGSHRVEALIRY
ncbi:MAG TPA: adenine phosphoribosyltransferase [Gemmatimonadaceae bacterium]|nr:adenine phosphoribosyltransferase [Gemmatimonadaceae bacterium]